MKGRLPLVRQAAAGNKPVISLKKYLDMDVAGSCAGEPPVSEPARDKLCSATLSSYRAALVAMGESGAQACPSIGMNLQESLTGLERRLAGDLTVAILGETDNQVRQQLRTWGELADGYYKKKADEVKELLLTLARTAESVGERDQRFTKHFKDLTDGLHAISNLEDLTQIRASLVQRAVELKTCVDQMEKDSHKLVAQLQAEVSTYESRLKNVEDLALRDTLTGLPNRRHVEERIDWRIKGEQTFCVVMVDLNRFKQVNDKHGHLAGDSILQQFAHELKSNLRSSDLVGRWGGDEFVLLLDCDLAATTSKLERMQRWVFGTYTIRAGEGSAEVKIKVDAAIGAAQWQRGETMQALIERADSVMFKKKAQMRPRGYSAVASS